MLGAEDPLCISRASASAAVHVWMPIVRRRCDCSSESNADIYGDWTELN